MVVKQVANVLELLEYFAELKKPLTLPQISAAMGWPRSSTFNLLSTLEQHGFLYEPRPRAGYYPTPRWNALSQRIAETELLPDDLYKVVAELVKVTGETVAVVGPARTNSVFLYVEESPAVIRFAVQVGSQIPIHAAASGQALLAQYTASERSSVLKKVKYEQYAPGVPMNPKEVEAQVQRGSRRGWFQNEGESTELTGVACPVGLQDRHLSVVVGGPTSRMRKRGPEIAAAMRHSLHLHGFQPDIQAGKPGKN